MQIYTLLRRKQAPGSEPASRAHGQHVLHDGGQLGEGHWGQREPVWEGEEFHGPGTLGGIVLQALCHILF